MINIEEFISKQYNMLIAPAGYGKTHTISECLKETDGKQLILTHTHAGVASLKEKVKKANILPSKYRIETITSFAQKYVLAFCTKDDIPKQEDSKVYYPFLVKEATLLVKKKLIKNIIKNSYSGVFVDEYQDCSIEQHELIWEIAQVLPTRLLGDHMQGIFDFNSSTIVDLECSILMRDFYNNQEVLETPWRWIIGGNESLGEDLKAIRGKLVNKENIDLRQFPSIEFSKTEETRLKTTAIYKIIGEEDSLLIIHPITNNINPRVKLIQTFRGRLRLMEPIDSKDFYFLSKLCDSITSENLILKTKELSLRLFNKTEINKWFNNKGLKRKVKEDEKLHTQALKEIANAFSGERKGIVQLLQKIKALPNVKCYRIELYNSLLNALNEADTNETTVYQAMIKNRNMVRCIGRKVYGKYVGTTLLTKGLEFDTVIVVEADKFECPKHLYVALTRASKRLIVYSKNDILNVY
ncbi:MAG: UvrD-helicase domain-containing protein [Aureispira sp.]